MTEPTPRTEPTGCTVYEWCYEPDGHDGPHKPLRTDQPTPQTEAGRELLREWVTTEIFDVDIDARILAIEAQARTGALDVETLAQVINDLDCIMGNGSVRDDPMLGLDYGTAHEWATAIISRLAAKETP